MTEQQPTQTQPWLYKKMNLPLLTPQSVMKIPSSLGNPPALAHTPKT